MGPWVGELRACEGWGMGAVSAAKWVLQRSTSGAEKAAREHEPGEVVVGRGGNGRQLEAKPELASEMMHLDGPM